MKRKINIKEISFMGICIAASMILSYVESLIPFGIPGLKIGLPNIFIVALLYKCGTIKASFVSIIRIILTSILFGSMMSFWYSLAGAVLSIFIMSLLKNVKTFSIVGVSVSGGIVHNMGQIIIAILITGVRQISYYIPVLIISGVVAGILVGIVAAIICKRLNSFE